MLVDRGPLKLATDAYDPSNLRFIIDLHKYVQNENSSPLVVKSEIQLIIYLSWYKLFKIGPPLKYCR